VHTCPQLALRFPGRSEGDKKLFSLLQKAYIDSRYTGDYAITPAELAQLAEKVHRIQALFKKEGAAAVAEPTKAHPTNP
jgi:hypothetical protein